jgi:hypothetical protein
MGSSVLLFGAGPTGLVCGSGLVAL